MKTVVTISKDISGTNYTTFINQACARYPQFSLVWRDQLDFKPQAKDIQQELHKFEINRSRTDTWPGTQLIGHQALVVRYKISAAKTGILLRPKSLFGWLSPDFPEDLAFYTSDGSCAIETISHESIASFYDTDWLSLLPKSANPELEKLPT